MATLSTHQISSQPRVLAQSAANRAGSFTSDCSRTEPHAQRCANVQKRATATSLASFLKKIRDNRPFALDKLCKRMYLGPVAERVVSSAATQEMFACPKPRCAELCSEREFGDVVRSFQALGVTELYREGLQSLEASLGRGRAVLRALLIGSWPLHRHEFCMIAQDPISVRHRYIASRMCPANCSRFSSFIRASDGCRWLSITMSDTPTHGGTA